VVDEWEKYIVETITKLNALSLKGFAFNMLPSYADEHFKKDYLYYAQPDWVKKICESVTQCEVTTLNNYGLFEFTVLINK
jgi:hypothetical protein